MYSIFGYYIVTGFALITFQGLLDLDQFLMCSDLGGLRKRSPRAYERAPSNFDFVREKGLNNLDRAAM